MKRYLGISFAAFCGALLFAGAVVAKPTQQYHLASEVGEVDAVGDVDGTAPAPSKVLQDTVWIADWSFDSGAVCVSTGWVKVDNRILGGAHYWVVDNRFAGLGGVIVSKSAILSKHDLCWARDGYGNDWDMSIKLKYAGAGATLTFNKAGDSEPGFDFGTVEADSADASVARANICTNPAAVASTFRTVLTTWDGLDAGSTVGPLALPNFGAGTHSVLIRFTADGGFSDEDGDYPSVNNAGLIVDNISVTGTLAYSENFEGVLNANVTFLNSANSTPFCAAPWVRVFSHITDNDKCTENTTCAWLGTDPLRIAFFPSMAFGPGQAVIHNWLDDLFVSPWVSLASTPSATGTVLSFRRFAGNVFAQGKIVQGWRVRGKSQVDNTDTSTLGDFVDCVSPWGHSSQFNSLSTFNWGTAVFDMTPHFSSTSTEVQVSFRNVDWQYLTGDSPPLTLNTGPGPYDDRVRIGRRVLTGPVISVGIDTRTQAQDAFPTVQNAIPGGIHYSPDGSNRFGTCAFSEGTELGINGCCTALITGDSILLESVTDARAAGGIASVKLFAAITAGPHAGNAPFPYTVSGSFFEVNADSAKNSSGVVVSNRWFVDMNDTYFRGGDVVEYLWICADNSGGRTSSPVGVTTATPGTLANARALTNGLREVSYLPAVNWPDAQFVAAMNTQATYNADVNDVAHPEWRDGGLPTQKNCILYYQKSGSNKNGGDINRSSFQYWLDRAGYRGSYDEYDVQGYGNTNNQLGGRANVGQASGYAIIIQDDGRSGLVPNVPDGSSTDNEKVNQAAWYRSYLAQGVTGLAGTASVWIIGENTAFEKSSNALFTTDMGLASIVTDQALSVNPNVQGGAAFTFASGSVQSFVGDAFSLNGGCPVIRAYDGANSSGTAVVTHNYKSGATTGTGAIVMNKNSVLKWNTIWMGFGWFDIRDAFVSPPATAPGTPELTMIQKIFNGTLPIGCIQAIDPTDTGDPDPSVDVAPKQTALFANVPNPFNPTTKIAFDLARAGQVKLQIFDVAGHVVKTLVNGATPAGRHELTWTGLDQGGRRVSSGVYFYQLVTDDFSQTRKMALLK